MKNSQIAVCIFYVVFIVLVSSNSYAWMCGVQDLDRKTGNNDLSSVDVSGIDNGTSKKTISASADFNIEDANKKYSPKIYFKNSKGKVRKFSGGWEGRNNFYLSSITLKQWPRTFNARFVIERKNGRKAYDSGWLKCK